MEDGANLSGSDISVKYNKLSGNTNFGVYNGASDTLTALKNSWGSLDGSGPYNALKNSSGTGDPVPNNVKFDPWDGKKEKQPVTNTGVDIDYPDSGTKLNFSSNATDTGHVTVQRVNDVPPNVVPSSESTAAPVYLEITSTLTNNTFDVTITLDVSDVPGFDSNTIVMYYNTVSGEWVTIPGGTYSAADKTFTFTTNHFTLFGFANSTAPLPVELESFAGEAKDGSVYLNWSTATEVNNYGFEIQRLSAEQAEWVKIGFVKGNGTSNSPKTYSFVDEKAPAGNLKYRLKQIDIDGKYEYSNVVEVSIETHSDFALEQNYPNPFNPTTKIKFSIPASGNNSQASMVNLSIYNILGQLVEVVINKEMSSGYHEVEFDGSHLTSGMYIYRLTYGGKSMIRKMLLVK